MAIPVIAASLIGGLISVTGTIVGRVLVALGVGVVTYTGVQFGIDSLLSNLDSAISGVPADILGLLGFMRVGEAINIIISAMSARMLLNGLHGDTIKKWVLK